MIMLRRVLAFVLCFVLVISFAGLVVPVSAVGAAVTAADLFTSLWGVYASSVGLETSFNSNGVSSSISNPFSETSSSSIFTSLYNEYATAISSNQTLSDWASWISDKVSVAMSPSAKTVIRMESAAVEFYDHFATWLLETKLGQTKTASGHFSSSGTWYNTQIGSVSNYGDYYWQQSGLTWQDYQIGTTSLGNGILGFAPRGLYFPVSAGQYYDSDGERHLVLVGSGRSTNSNWQDVYFHPGSNSQVGLSRIVSGSGVYYIDYVCFSQGASWGNYSLTCPIYNDRAAVISAYSAPSALVEKIQLRPKDKYNEQTGNDVLGIPDVDAQDYAPDAITDVLSRPWDDSLTGAAALDPTLAWVLDKLLANLDVEDVGSEAVSPSISNDPSNYAVLGLADVFPFCLPFDLYNFFNCLAADPVAPSFEVPIEFPPLDMSYTFEIDLSEFDTVAALLRKLELLGFCVALILITRQKMIRG